MLLGPSGGPLTTPLLFLPQGGFSNGSFLCTSDTFDVSRRGVVSLRTDAALDRETTDSYTLLVPTSLVLPDSGLGPC